MNHHEEAPRPPAGPRPESEALPAPWAEAAAVLQAEQDADVHQEARDLAVAEMAAVTLTDRISALSPSASVEIALVDSWTVVGEVEHATSDHLLLRDVQGPVLLPAHAIASISSLPHVMHDDATKPVRTTWRSVLREYFGRGLHVSFGTPVRTINGSLSWVGRDHLSIRTERDEVTCSWSAVCSVRLPSGD